MKKGIHPEEYRLVVFKDITVDESFLTRSCAPTKDTIKWTDGNEYPLVKVEISSKSHPFFTGKMQFVDTAGRIDKFNKRFSNTKFAKTTIDGGPEEDAKEDKKADSKPVENKAADSKPVENKAADDKKEEDKKEDAK